MKSNIKFQTYLQSIKNHFFIQWSYFLVFFFFFITLFLLDRTAVASCLCWVVVGSTGHFISRASWIVGWRCRDIHRTRVVNRLRRTTLTITTVSRVNWISWRGSGLISLWCCSIGRRCWRIRRTEVVIVGCSGWIGWTVTWMMTSGWIASWMVTLLLWWTIWGALLGHTCRIDWAATSTMAWVVCWWIISSRVHISWTVPRHASRRIDWTLVVATTGTLVRSMVINLIYWGLVPMGVYGRLIVGWRRHTKRVGTVRVRIVWWLHRIRSWWETTRTIAWSVCCDAVLWSGSIVVIWCHASHWCHGAPPINIVFYNWSISSYH